MVKDFFTVKNTFQALSKFNFVFVESNISELHSELNDPNQF